MSNRKQKLELTWIGKDNRPKLEPRILIEDPEKSYHAKYKVSENDLFDNVLVHGDNLLALKALEQDFTGEVKCVYIDPPYNTGQMFDHYDDGLEHSIWLSQMRDRLEVLKKLLHEEGTIWINLDDNEAHYCKVICDEIFGRNNFLGNVIWEKADSPRMDAVFFSYRHDHILVFAKNKNKTSFNRFEFVPDHYDKTDEAGRRYYLKPLRAMGGQGDSRQARPTLYYPIISPDGTEVYPKKQDGSDGAWRWRKEKVTEENSRIAWVEGRNGWTPYYKIYADQSKGRPAETIFPHSVVGSNRTSKAEIKKLFPDLVPFSTPKPEKLLGHIIHIATNPGDLVLDSFLGSGTTVAVAHKMKRRWIGIELGAHCEELCLPRLKQVISGQDDNGVTEDVNWNGGGGFRYYRLGPSLISKDEWGNPVINPDFNPSMLTEAMCKLEGFHYSPSDETYWIHGFSTESDYIYVCTQFMTREMLTRISDDVGSDRSLLIYCTAFKCNPADFPNLTIKKIPKAVLQKCEWGRDDYSLAVNNLPSAPIEPDFDDEDAESENISSKATGKKQSTIFDLEQGGKK